MFFNKKQENELKKYKYPDNCIVLSIYAPIDGFDIIHIKDDKPWYEHVSWKQPGWNSIPSIINGVKWYPKFVNNISDKFELQLPIPEKEYYIYAKNRILKTKSVKIIRQPNKKNNYTLSISLDDNALGGDTVFKMIIYYYLPEEMSFINP